MSQLTSCNRCTLKLLRKRKSPGESIKVVEDKDSGMGGFNVYQFPKGHKIIHSKHFVAWLMEIPERCEC